MKRLAVRIRSHVVATAACEAAADCARSFELAYRELKELASGIEFVVDLGLTKPELVNDLVQTCDRMSAAIYSYRRSLLA